MSKQTYMQSMDALGTSVELRVVAENKSEAEESLKELWSKVVQFENTFSRFVSDSELSQLNARSGEKVFISEMFTDILEQAIYFSELTDGLFNPFILPSLQRAGYVQSMTTADADVLDYTTREVVPYTALEIGNGWVRIPKNSALDLGGIGKGYLADHLGSCIKKPIKSYCLSVGGDMLLRGKNEQDNFWNVDIQSGSDRNKIVAQYITQSVEKIGVATSGIVRKKKGKEQGHQIHPEYEGFTERTKYSLCSVVADNATTADVMASIILLGGADFAEVMMKKGRIQAVLLQDKNENTPILIGQGFSLLYC